MAPILIDPVMRLLPESRWNGHAIAPSAINVPDGRQTSRGWSDRWMADQLQQDELLGALGARQTMSTQALNNPDLQRRMLELLLGSFGLWEGLREKGSTNP